MKNALILFFVFFCCCDARDATPTCVDQEIFSYDVQSGVCKNCRGDVGFNPVDLAQIRESKVAECLHLKKIELLLLLGDSVEIPNRLSYQQLENYNFRGSVLDSCYLFFNFVTAADFRGTDLRSLRYGYAAVRGRRDGFTKVPETGSVTLTDDSVFCAN